MRAVVEFSARALRLPTARAALCRSASALATFECACLRLFPTRHVGRPQHDLVRSARVRLALPTFTGFRHAAKRTDLVVSVARSYSAVKERLPLRIKRAAGLRRYFVVGRLFHAANHSAFASTQERFRVKLLCRLLVWVVVAGPVVLVLRAAHVERKVWIC